ncbi:MAG: hypothetical protein J2P28_05755 [Actinobacteria bacterium]|nr:hypothetical protein [Actinomycetota bacterium]
MDKTTLFHIYVTLLIISGIAMLVLAGIGRGSNGRRIWNGLFGAGYTIYGLYLLLVFNGGTYFVIWYAFILPIMLIVAFFRDRGVASSRRNAGGYPQASQGYGQPPQGYGQPPGAYGGPPEHQ